MFSKLATILVAASLALSVSAGTYHCNTSEVQCCNQMHSLDSDAGAFLRSLISVNVQDVTGKIALGCSPITIIGTGSGANCGTTPVCCNKDKINGLISIGCTPAAIGA